MPYRFVFMGSPDFAARILAGLAANYPIAGVFTQPDRESGRGKNFTPPPVKTTAVALNIPVFQPHKLKSPDAFADLEALQPDIIIVAAYGQILRQNVLDLPKFGCINVHASYLPRWRGAAPIQAAILAGDTFTGISIMRMDAGIDTGPILAQEKVNIENQETAITLERKLSVVGTELLVKTLPDYLCGRIRPQKQPVEGSTYAGMLTKQDGLLDFSKTANELERKTRAYDDWPGTFILVSGQILKIRKSRVIERNDLAMNDHGIHEGLPVVGTGKGALVLVEVQPAGKKWMSGVDYLRGYQKSWLNA